MGLISREAAAQPVGEPELPRPAGKRNRADGFLLPEARNQALLVSLQGLV